MTKSIAINVGVNKNPRWGGFRGPIFSNGSFGFIHFPWQDKYGLIEPRPPKYSEMSYSQYVPKEYLNKQVFISPDFKNSTYASTSYAPANKHILNLDRGDYLLFYATLEFRDEKGKKEDWINPTWGAYIVGFFKIDSIFNGLKDVLSDKNVMQNFKEYAWFRVLWNMGIKDDGETPWVKGVGEESGLLKKALPLSSPDLENPQKWSNLACSLFRTSKGKKLDTDKKAIFQSILSCKDECLDKLLEKCELRK